MQPVEPLPLLTVAVIRVMQFVQVAVEKVLIKRNGRGTVISGKKDGDQNILAVKKVIL